jgi:RNA polymerase sigma-70 factor (sigma-E family)
MRQTEEDFRGWVGARRSTLRATAYLLCGDWYLADDLVQDALAKIYSVWPRIAGAGDPDPYARRVLLNVFLDHRRRPWRREVTSESLPDRPSDAPESDAVHPALVVALREVPPGQRAVLVLRFWDDLSVEQAAAALGTSIGNVKSQTSRGLVALRAALAAQGVSTRSAWNEELS